MPRLLAIRRGNKYGARRESDGVRSFDSAGERRRAQELQIMEKAGCISGLEYQPRFELRVNGVLITHWRADFRYRDEESGEVIVEDFKGVRTDRYLMCKRLMKAVHGIDVLETGARKRR